MSTDNYFKSDRELFFFDSSDRDGILAAWESAVERGRPVAVFNPIPKAGPWRTCCDVVGLTRCVGLREIDPNEKDADRSLVARRNAKVRLEYAWSNQTSHVPQHIG